MKREDFGYKLDRTAIDVCDSFAEAEERERREQWALTPHERLRMAEFLRVVAYGRHGYEPATARLPRALEVAQLEGR